MLLHPVTGVLERVYGGSVFNRAQLQLLNSQLLLLFHQSRILVVLDLLAFSKCWRFLFRRRAHGRLAGCRTRLTRSASQREVLMILRIKLIHGHVRVTQVLVVLELSHLYSVAQAQRAMWRWRYDARVRHINGLGCSLATFWHELSLFGNG